jgi:hypothetical protein
LVLRGGGHLGEDVGGGRGRELSLEWEDGGCGGVRVLVVGYAGVHVGRVIALLESRCSENCLQRAGLDEVEVELGGTQF